jgi:hypothetical protein
VTVQKQTYMNNKSKPEFEFDEVQRVCAEGEQIVVTRRDATLMELDVEQQRWNDKEVHQLPLLPGVLERWTQGWNPVDKQAAVDLIAKAEAEISIPPPSTIESLEELARTFEAEEEAERLRLHRRIMAYARILAVREPDTFSRQALEYADVDGHYDSSYPPQQQYKNLNGPRLHMVMEANYEDIATSHGFYYDWKAVTEDPGLYIAPDGSLYGRDSEGTGKFGSFAAYPGDHQVEICFEWVRLPLNEIPRARLQAAEYELRTKAFPLIASRAAR